MSLQTEWGRYLHDKLILKLPGLGDLMQQAVLEQFCRMLSSMVIAGVPLPEAMGVTAEVTNNRVYRRGLGCPRSDAAG